MGAAQDLSYRLHLPGHLIIHKGIAVKYKWVGVVGYSMYTPENGIIRETVIMLTAEGPALGKFTGNSRERSESFEIEPLDHWKDQGLDTSFFHKEDLWENTSANWESLKGL